MKYLFIVNPVAGKGLGLNYIKRIEIESENIVRVNIDGEIVETEKLVMEVIPKSIKLIISAS